MRNTFRPTDFLGRWGEDQFLAILVNCDGAGLQSAGERARKVTGCAGLRWWGDQLSVTTSIGCATVRPGDTADALLERARLSLSEASALSLRAENAGSTRPVVARTNSER